MKHRSVDRAPDYTVAALVSLGVNLFCLMVAIWATFGMPAVLILALAVDRSLLWLAQRRHR